jgi:hypothetical protein
MNWTRREFLKTTAAAGTGLSLGLSQDAVAQMPGERPKQSKNVSVINPRARVPLSFIIDDSTCLVNMGHFCMPQFAESLPDRESYKKPWWKTPREIPDDFVRKFGDWCGEHEVKGKYSIVPYPACVGWVDRYMPGWSKKALNDSLKLVRDRLMSNWDIHPEMVSHTRVINTKTGRPYESSAQEFMENWRWTDGKSVDQLADYMSYALKILKNVELPCEGITTPGGFGNRVLPELAQATLQSCRDVFNAEIPHYFRHLYTDKRSVVPRVEYASGLTGDDPKCVVSIIGCTGDWFGGWDGMTPGSVDRFITKDLSEGRMVEVIDRGEPAIMVCHWPGIYYNGKELGFNIFKEAVTRMNQKYDHLIWMKLSEISRYWAAKELTTLDFDGTKLKFKAPFASPLFTVEVNSRKVPTVIPGKRGGKFHEVKKLTELKSGTWFKAENKVTVCFDLGKGASEISFG